MAVPFGCKCEVKNKENWRVLHRNHNHSYFESPKGGEHYSEYSTVLCLKCNNHGRTKANYVNKLKEMSPEESSNYYKPNVRLYVPCGNVFKNDYSEGKDDNT